MSKMLKVHQIDEKIYELKYTGDWVDVRVSAVSHIALGDRVKLEQLRESQKQYDRIHIMEGDEIKVYHGFAAELPEGYEADLRPRGSLFKNTGLIFTASGVIDESYNGNNDEWFSTFKATRDTELAPNQRICQFRIQEKQPDLIIKHFNDLGNQDRGGHGSTGDF